MKNSKIGEMPRDTDHINAVFNAQLQRYENGTMRADEYILLGMPQGVIRQFLPNNGIILRQKVLSKARKKHNLLVRELRNLPKALLQPIFIFKSTEDSIGVLTEMETHSGQNIFVAISIVLNRQLGSRFLDVNDVTSIHGREVENVIYPIIENHTLQWVDKEKGLRWLSSAKTNSQAIATETLSMATKIIQTFENPKVLPDVEAEKTARPKKNHGFKF